ncbi:MAG: hypothetical protein ACPK85_15320 [Methanosarcina sp.]
MWKQKSILILLIDLDTYNGFDTQHLDISENKYLETLQTSYFKKRYAISRLVLKEIILSLFKEHFPFKNQALSEIHTFKDEYGRVHVRYEPKKNSSDRCSKERDPEKENNHEKSCEKLNLCISYTDNLISLAISKVDIGMDIELRRSFPLQRLSGYLDPFKLGIEYKESSLKVNPERNSFGYLVTLTLKEAYCKFSNIDMLSNLNKNPDFNNLFYSVFILRDKYLLSLVADKSFYAETQEALELISINHLKT